LADDPVDEGSHTEADHGRGSELGVNSRLKLAVFQSLDKSLLQLGSDAMEEEQGLSTCAHQRTGCQECVDQVPLMVDDVSEQVDDCGGTEQPAAREGGDSRIEPLDSGIHERSDHVVASTDEGVDRGDTDSRLVGEGAHGESTDAMSGDQIMCALKDLLAPPLLVR